MIKTQTARNRSLSLLAMAAFTFSLPTLLAQEPPPIRPELSGAVEKGILIVDGEFVEPPYVFQSGEDGIFVNQIPLDITSLGLAENDFWRWDMVPPSPESESEGGAEVRFRRTAIQPRFPWRHIETGLRQNDVVVVAKGERPCSLLSMKNGRLFVELLLDDNRRTGVSVDDVQEFGEINQEAWIQWIRKFKPSAPFQTQAGILIRNAETIMEGNTNSMRANQRLAASSYPLTVIGMVLVVLAVGHLISHRPPATTQTVTMPAGPGEQRAAAQCLVLIVFLSALDLIWTLLAHQAGAMRELNPLGARLVDDPGQLILFKVIATLIGTGLLFGTRRFVISRKAAWWCCLTCTLLAARWIGINSVFV